MRRIYRNYILQVILLIILFLTFINSGEFVKIFLSVFLIIYTIIICKLIKKNRIISIKSRQVTLAMLAFGIIGVSIYYLMGLYFGFARSTVLFSIWGIIRYIIPISIIIVTSEIIRYRFSMQSDTKLSKFLVISSMVLMDIIIYTQVYDITVLNDFLAVIGFVLFASVASNLLYEYISPKYGFIPIIVYRLILGLYSYIIPVVPDIYIFFKSVLRMLYPYLIYLVLDFVFEKKKNATEYKSKKRNYIYISFIITIAILIAMLISCKFYYGIIVIGSGSMTGTINKGDATVFVKYEGQEIKEGDVLIFQKDNRQIVHRVISKTKVGESYRYYTKGDANVSMDEEYIENSDIIGICKLRVPYIGYPTLWLRNTFEKN